MTKQDTGATQAGAIIFVDGDKGGVGKSWTSCSLLDWLLVKKQHVAAVDGDTRNPDVDRMFSGAIPTLKANLRLHTGWMDMLDFIVANPTATIVVSMPAGIGDTMKKEAAAFVQNMQMLGRPLGLFWVMNRQADSVNLLNQALGIIGDALKFKVAVKNLMFGDTDKFIRWDGSQTKKQFEKTGGVTIDLTELHERTVDKLLGDSTGQTDVVMPFSQAVMPVADCSKSPHGLTPSENMELITWLRENHNTLNSVVAPLLSL
ncbi:hypothetical protein [Agrobacterium tumefaciens]|uniref:hypothetical protein n=1 Tax=Agrobacterium tumefaciens TaxID=358 RepID=UPI0015728590|nr:hypothetical protein [Agrobacterium tumefaciens]NTB05947.1 hypothetical protein [Agrobacterium tumefaciens]